MNRHREFLTQVGAFAATTSFDAGEWKAASAPAAGTWDTAWIEPLASASYRAVFNAEDIADGAALAYAETFLDHFHEAHGTADADASGDRLPAAGTPIALDDVLWDRYGIGEDAKINDSRTRGPARRAWRSATSSAA